MTDHLGTPGRKAHPPSLSDLVRRIAPRPLLLVYSGRGRGGEELTPDYFRGASPPKATWRILEAGHVGGFQGHPDEYERRLLRAHTLPESEHSS